VCKADLPEKLRFGRIDVSCEGWDHPGDPFVMKGSCGLEYRLVHIDGESKWNIRDFLTVPNILTTITFGFAAFFLIMTLYTLLEPCIKSYFAPIFRSGTGPRRRRDSSTHPSGSGAPPPPPYSAAPPIPPYPKPGPSSSTQSGDNSGPFGNFQPGFWSGLGLGGLGATMAQRFYRRDGEQYRQRPRPAGEYDWERERVRRPGAFSPFPSFASSPEPASSSVRSRRNETRASGSGSSTLGQTRSSTGYGTSSVR